MGGLLVAESPATVAPPNPTSPSHASQLLYVLSGVSPKKMASSGLSSLAHTLSTLRPRARPDSPGRESPTRPRVMSWPKSLDGGRDSSVSSGGSSDRWRRKKSTSSPPRPDASPRLSQEKKEEKNAERRERRQIQQEKIVEWRRSEDTKARENVDPETRARYGDEPPASDVRELVTIAKAAEKPLGSEVTFRARIHHHRDVSKALDFLLLRDQTHSIQGVLQGPSEMVKWAQRLNSESIVQVTGTLQKPPVGLIRSASHQDLEILITTIHLVSPARVLPFSNYQPPSSMNTRIAGRVVDLRHPANQALFRVRAAVTRAFRASLDAQGFVEIQTPKLQPAATESGAQVFKVNYFGRAAFLAQSPQLAKQMSISADFKRVYEVGPVFRAENSNTHRHLTEFTGMDIEMSIDRSYHEVIHTVDTVLKSIFAAVRDMPELQTIRERWPSEDLVWLDETPIIRFQDAIQMLREEAAAAASTDDSNSSSTGAGAEVGAAGGADLEDDEDLSTRDEIRLGEIVKRKYGTDYFILDKFPASVRPFYTRRDEADPRLTNSFDVFLRGQEIGTGGQRIHDADELHRAMADAGVTPDGLEDYLDAFEYGAPPHGGTGLGLDRIVAFLLELGDVRLASEFHRDTKSFPRRPPTLPHPEASTKRNNTATSSHTAQKPRALPPPPPASLSLHTPPASPTNPTTAVTTSARNKAKALAAQAAAHQPAHSSSSSPFTYPPIEKLIANYGDAANTSWLDDRFSIWRHPPTGSAVGFVRQGEKLAITTGDPLCDPSQFPEVLASFIHFCEHSLRRTPVFLIVSEQVQSLLAAEHGFRTLTCIEEQRVDPDAHAALKLKRKGSGAAERNMRRVAREGIRVREVVRPEKDPAFVGRAEEAVRRWRAARKGRRQVHLTEIRPWVDQEHRRYFVAERGGTGGTGGTGSGGGTDSKDKDKDSQEKGAVLGLVVLARLAPKHGWQIKWALDIPGAPSGTIEVLIDGALGAVAGSPVTFGTGVSRTLKPRAHIGHGRARVLQKTYEAFAKGLGLGRKSVFREKFGVVGEEVFVAYPKHGLGVGELREIVRFFED